MNQDSIDRFWGKVDKSGECWIWTASLFSNGYGYYQLSWKPRKVGLAHRIAYQLIIGDIPEGLDLDHLCRVRNCVNPDHLEPVTRSENLKRSSLMGRQSEKTHCPQGHPYSGSNLYEYKGRRHCRECRNRHIVDKRARMKVAS